MKIFYDYLKTGEGRAESLKLAREEIKAKYKKPILLVRLCTVWRGMRNALLSKLGKKHGGGICIK